MTDSVAAVVLAAGAGTRLRPLTRVRPKPLCPVGDRPLVDHARERVGAVTDSIAVNVHHGRALMEAHLAGRVHLSIEAREALGTAGALGLLREWIDGRPTLVVNADTWTTAELRPLLDGWDGERIRALVAGDGAFGAGSRVAGALMPWGDVKRLRAKPAGLWEVSWRAALAKGRLETVATGAPLVDCGTPGSYLAANLVWSGGEPVVGRGAVVEGTLTRSVVWPGGVVYK
ncbi:MAG: nucleotidyltransferase family protein, partial [Acidimicrobiales bacterium]